MLQYILFVSPFILFPFYHHAQPIAYANRYWQKKTRNTEIYHSVEYHLSLSLFTQINAIIAIHPVPPARNPIIIATQSNVDKSSLTVPGITILIYKEETPNTIIMNSTIARIFQNRLLKTSPSNVY